MKAIALAAALLVAACEPGVATSTPTSPPPATRAAASPATPAATPAPTPAPTPAATDLAGVAAQVLYLGADAAPIDVAYAFGSIWVASHHYNAVIRIDPETLDEIARIKVGNGPGWIAVTDDAVWVTQQLGRGLSRIDPLTNISAVQAGDWATCYAPVVAFGSIWQAACDAHQVMRIDPTTYESTDITVGDQGGLVLAGEQVLAGGPLGLSRIDPATNTVETIGGQAGRAIGYAGGTVWISDETQVFRVEPTTGAVISTLPITFAWIVTEHEGRAWVVQESTAALRIRPRDQRDRPDAARPSGTDRGARGRGRPVGHRIRRRQPLASRALTRRSH